MPNRTLSLLAPWPLLSFDKMPVVVGLFLVFFGVVLIVLGIFAYQDREMRPAIVRTIFGLAMLASGLSMWGVF